MAKERGILYIFDLDNYQQQYADCLEFICILQRQYPNLTEAERLSRIRELSENIRISGMRTPEGSKNFFEQPLEMKGSPLQVVANAKPVEAKNIQGSILERSPSTLHYHIRIHLHDADHKQHLSNLHFFALFLQKLTSIFPKESDSKKALDQVSVFIVPASGSHYPFGDSVKSVDFETYKNVSQYLRLLSKENTGIIYGVVPYGENVAVRALDFKMPNRFPDYFPLIPLNEKTYGRLFDDAFAADSIKDLFGLKENRRFHNANNSDPYLALSDFVAETAFRQLKRTLEQCKPTEWKELLSLVRDELLEQGAKEKLCLLTLAVFLFTLHITDDYRAGGNEAIQLSIRQNLAFSTELSAGLRQIVQNTLQHSASHEGVLSFYLESDNSASPPSSVLRVLLSDYNDQQSFVDNFVSNLRRETAYINNPDVKRSYLELCEYKGSISLGHFFGEYQLDKPDDAWNNFRRADTSAHIGLLLFSLTMQRCKGSVRLINSTDFTVTAQNYFFHCYDKKANNQTGEGFDPQERVIPGTHMDLTIPVGPIEGLRPMGLGQLNSPQSISETYSSFAEYLEHQPEEVAFSESEFLSLVNARPETSGILIDNAATDAIAKHELVYCWEKYWNAQNAFFKQTGMSKKCVYYLDLETLSARYLNSSDSTEIFIKGFINAIDSICKDEREFLFAFTNAPASFIQTLRQISISLAPKRFPANLQLYAVESSSWESLHLVGTSYAQAIKNAYTLSMEHGMQSYSHDEMTRAQVLFAKAVESADRFAPQSVCPFDVILPNPRDRVMSLFDAKIRTTAERAMDGTPAGYKLENTHMRLGSKVHIRAFYEMAFLFYRTNISNRVAFEILKNIREQHDSDCEESIDLHNDNILFYGYASYSKALLTSVLEILKAYRINSLKEKLQAEEDGEAKKALQDKLDRVAERLALASYQHNLQSEFQSESTALYFDFCNSNLGEKTKENKVRFCRPVKVVQIVPISSTLTTFDKMESRLSSTVESADGSAGIHANARYTVFWVTDKLAGSLDSPREETEKKYWKLVHPKLRLIELHEQAGKHTAPIHYFMRSPVVWEDPLECKLCYPDYVIEEVPLVETDQTSTVPAQQLHSCEFPDKRHNIDHEVNDQRLLALRSCVTYGHIRREKNHFQFYLETQDYFNRVCGDVQKWLTDLRERDERSFDASHTALDIIFSPEHATNVGFAQYVNNYYFRGNAEVVCINEDKEFRSNFKCEHMALTKTIRELLSTRESNDNLPVRFYFVDDTVSSGETFHKAVSFLHSLIPSEFQHLFPANLIRKCFLLIDRLSDESKQAYVNNVAEDFYSFLHIDLSNMRIQGDSCVCCKLKLNAKKLFRRSSTRSIAKYWNDKVKRYAVLGYNERPFPEQVNTGDKAYRKLVLSHITQNVLFRHNKFFDPGDIYDSILTIISEILDEPISFGVSFQYEHLMREIRGDDHLPLIEDFLKLLSRPFFSFDFKVKLQTMTFLLIFSEYLVDGKNFSEKTLKKQIELNDNSYKSFLLKKDRIEKTFQLLDAIKERYLRTKEDQILFIQDCLIDNLVELRSTYMMRKSTLVKMYRFLRPAGEAATEDERERETAFWKNYVAGIHQILDYNSDETRSLWLEHLLINGEECASQQEKSAQGTPSPQSLFRVLTENAPIESNRPFYDFCNELFLQNSRVLFDGIENSLERDNSENAYYMEYWKECRALDYFLPDDSPENPTQEERDLFKAFKQPYQESAQYKVKQRYDTLLEKISKMASAKYNFERIDIALITWFDDRRDAKAQSPEINQLDLVSCRLDSKANPYFNKFKIKEKLVKALESQPALNEYGYDIHEKSEDNRPYFFIYFDCLQKPIVPVYLYFSFAEAGEFDQYNLMLFLRDLLSYRNRILRALKADFSGDIFSKYAHTSGEKSILAHEKATSHNTTGDDSVTLEIFMDPKSAVKYDVLDSDQVLKWLLLHNYTNAQIAKLFNRSYRTHEEYDNAVNLPTPPPLYLKDADQETLMMSTWFQHPLRTFSDLRLLDDGRFALLDTVVPLNYDSIMDAQFLSNDEGQFYNVEYFKSILIDIIISAMKFGTASVTYLERVDKYLYGANKLRHKQLLSPEECSMLETEQCKISFEIRDAEREEDTFKYLVIQNEVDKIAHELYDWNKRNDIIHARLKNPIDYADGHMSMLAISHYVEGLWPEKLRGKSKFRYIGKGEKLVFETSLPIIRKE